MALPVTQSFAFVSTGDLGRTKASDRTLIRSHCMRGKNRKHPPRRNTREVVSPDDEAHQVARLSNTRASANAYPSPISPSQHSGSEYGEAESSTYTADAQMLDLSIPPPGPPTLSLIKLAGEVDDHSRELFFKYFTMARNVFYPVDFCLKIDPSWSTWLGWLSEDVAYLHSALMGTSYIQDYMMKRSPTKLTYYHLKKTITLLNAHLSDQAFALRDSTVGIILALALGAEVSSDLTAASAHVRGLRKMVGMRGGLKSFQDNAKLHVKIRRLDILVYLCSGEAPHYAEETAIWSPLFSSCYAFPENVRDHSSCSVQSVDGTADPRLVVTLGHLQYFAGALNLAATCEELRLLDNDFQNFYCSLQYRLLGLHGEFDGVLDECLRLAMLAFLASTFLVPGKKVRYPYLANQLKQYYCLADFSAPRLLNLRLWTLMIGSISVWETDEPWLKARWLQDVPELTWGEARKVLQETMWIDVIHDGPGKYTFEMLTGQQGE